MNQTVCFAVEDLTARRTSTRARGMPILPAKCFRKIYRKKEEQKPVVLPANIQSDHHQILQSPREEIFRQLAKCASLLYTPVASDSVQSKAILNYRVKKLKKTLRTQADILKAIKDKSLPPRVGLNTILRATKPNSRSLFALSRVRDCHGRFYGSSCDQTKSVSYEDTAVDSREFSQSATASRPSLMSGCFDDFFSYYGSDGSDALSVDASPLHCNIQANLCSNSNSMRVEQFENRRTLFGNSTKTEATSFEGACTPKLTVANSDQTYPEPEYTFEYPLSAHEDHLLSCLQSFDDFDFMQQDPEADYPLYPRASDDDAI